MPPRTGHDRPRETGLLSGRGSCGLVRLLVVMGLSLALCPAAIAQSTERLLAGAEARYDELVEQMRGLAPLGAVDETGAVPGEPRDVSVPRLVTVDLRVALLKLARKDEAESHDVVLKAQGARGTSALSLSAGTMDLSGLLAEAGRLFPGMVGADGLGVPLIVEEGATLVLDRGEVLTLARTSGAFLANFGTLDIRGAGIVVAGSPNPDAPAFAPFVVTAGKGVMVAHDAYFADLGFGSDLISAGLSVVVSRFYQNETRSSLKGSVLRRVGSTVFAGGEQVDVLDNRFLDSRRTALILHATKDARIHRNTFVDGAAGDAIRLGPQTDGTDIESIEIFHPRESGIALLPGSFGTEIRDVTILRPRHHGVQADTSDCLEMHSIRILGPRQEGIALRASRGVVLKNSAVIASGRAGLLVADMSAEDVTYVFRNQFRMNRIGIQTAAPGQLDLRNNNFEEQFPRFLAGDVQFMSPVLMRDLTGEARIVLAGGGAPDAVSDAPVCPNHQEP